MERGHDRVCAATRRPHKGRLPPNASVDGQVMTRVTWIPPEAALEAINGRGNWRQFPAYAQNAAERVGSISRYCLIDNGTPIAVANIRTKAFFGLGCIHLLSHGPVIIGLENHAALTFEMALRALWNKLASEGPCELRIDPALSRPADLCVDWFENAEVVQTHDDAFRTIRLDLSAGAESVRMGFEPKWRRELARAEREGLQVQRSHRGADMLLMAPLLNDLAQQKGFTVPQDSRFFAKTAERCIEPERYFIHLIRREGRLVSAHIGAYSGDTAMYLLGATNEEGRASRAAYLAQWAAIETALATGCRYYDLGGVDPIGNPDVYRFKRRMGGEDLSNGGAWSVRRSDWRSHALSSMFKAYQRLKRSR